MIRTRAGELDATVIVQLPDGPPVPNGDGGYTQAWTDATPRTWHVAIAPLGASERADEGTTLAVDSEIVRGPYRADLTTAARLVHGPRTLQVVAVQNLAARDRELVLTCVRVTAA